MCVVCSSGKAVGIISTARITHATPGAGYAHTPERNWESAADMKGQVNCTVKDIARQLIEDHSEIQVLLKHL